MKKKKKYPTLKTKLLQIRGKVLVGIIPIAGKCVADFLLASYSEICIAYFIYF